MKILFVCLLGVSAIAQTPKVQTFDSRLRSSTIVREDLFAGFMANDDGRRQRGERNVEILLAERPQDRPVLTAWKAGIALDRAVSAAEAGRTNDFDREYWKALDLFAEASRLDPADLGVMITQGAAFATFSDRLPLRYREEGWNKSYQAYGAVWKRQEANVTNFPLHLKGELLAGMAQSAERTGHSKQSAQFLEQILATMPGTPYAAIAKKWIESPAAAAGSNLTCQTCHEAGRLEARKASLASSK